MNYRILLKYTFIIILTNLLLGCGQGSLVETNLTQIDLQAGAAVAVSPGDRLIPVSEKTRINITHVLEDGTKSVTILTGSATLIKGNYFQGNLQSNFQGKTGAESL